MDTLYLKCLLIVLCSFHIAFVLSSLFVQNSLTLYKTFKQQTTWICSVIALFTLRKQGGALLAFTKLPAR